MTQLDIDELSGRIRRVLHADWPDVQVLELSELMGGASSLTYTASLAAGPAARVVVKVAPPGLPPVRNRDVLRQAALLARLAEGSAVRVPRVFGTDAGAPPAEPPLFVMSFEPGDSAEPLLARSTIGPDHVASRARHAARMLAALHRVDPVGIAEPPIDPATEVERWSSALATVPAELLGSSTDDLGGRLGASAPAAEPARLTHGDWRLGNTLCVEGEIRAVIDWEIWAFADPRTDLAWFLTNCDPSHPIAVAGPETGMPPIDGLVAEYERALDRRVSDLDWFRALAVYKQAATTALLAKNAAKRGRPMEQVTGRMTRRLPEMFHWAGAFLAGDTTG